MLCRILAASLLCLSLAAHAAESGAPTVVHLLDYIGVDYPQFVKDGKVVSEDEYKEQKEFAGQVAEILGRLPAVPQRVALIEEAGRLRSRVEAKAPGAEVSKMASDLRWKVIGAYQVAVAPKMAPDPKRGDALYQANCAACHGAQGRGDGVAGAKLDPRPSDFHNRERMEKRSLYGLYSTITLGVNGTAMTPFSQLSDDDRWALAFHVGTLDGSAADAQKGAELWKAGRGRAEVGTLKAVATLTEEEVAAKHGAEVAKVFAWLKAHPQALDAVKESPIAFSRRLLAQSMEAYRAGKAAEAQQLALTSYLEGFELAEAGLDAVDHALRLEVESQMIVLRDLMRRGASATEVETAARRIDGLLATSADKLDSGGLSPTTAAVSAFFILVREGLEALLVVAAIIAFLKKAGRREALPWIHAGWVGALALGGVTWIVASKLIAISGATRELTEGFTALFAAGILLYVGFWLHGKSQAQAWKAYISEHLTAALGGGTLWALAGVSFLAVYREAFETVLFYEALWQQAGEGSHGVLVGFLCGVVALAVTAWAILRYSIRLPIGLFFAACSVLMALLAVIFAGHGVKALQEAGMIAATPAGGVQIQALGVYPSVETLAAQLLTIAIIAGVYFWMRAAARRGAAAA